MPMSSRKSSASPLRRGAKSARSKCRDGWPSRTVGWTTSRASRNRLNVEVPSLSQPADVLLEQLALVLLEGRLERLHRLLGTLHRYRIARQQVLHGAPPT